MFEFLCRETIKNLENQIEHLENKADSLNIKVYSSNEQLVAIKEQLDNTIKQLNEKNVLLDRYKNIRNEEAALAQLREEYNTLESEVEKLKNLIQNKQNELEHISDEIIHKKSELINLDNSLLAQEVGVYEHVYRYENSSQYKKELDRIIEMQKAMIARDKAIICNTDWVIAGSVKKGEKFINDSKKQILLCFNNECNVLITKVKYNNIEQYLKKLEKVANTLNKLNKSSDMYINSDYIELKRMELMLTYEYATKEHEEKEEQKRIKQLMKEEAAIQKEADEAVKQAEREEIIAQKAYEKALKELSKNTVSKESYEEVVKNLEAQLQLAQEKSKRAISRAQLTKSGHVYVISNIGSFGENIYKIGMTRRLEPLDRVDELGDASVPFKFDVHAMIYSENAPELEKQLHDIFASKQVNKVNKRKEFYKVTLSEIEQAVLDLGYKVDWVKIPEAKEFRESCKL